MKAFQTEYNDMMEPRDVKIALFFIHQELVNSAFASMDDVEKIRVIAKGEVEIITTTSVRRYTLDYPRECMEYIGSTSREDVKQASIT